MQTSHDRQNRDQVDHKLTWRYGSVIHPVLRRIEVPDVVEADKSWMTAADIITGDGSG